MSIWNVRGVIEGAAVAEERGRVWLLEDSALEAEMARRALAPTQQVTIFDDGSALLERLATGARPDVLVLDRQLLGVNGLEVCRVVREMYGAMILPILMLTVESGKQDIVEGFHAGANDYVTKPYHVAELVARVGTLVHASRLASSQASRTRQLALGAEVGAALTEARGLAEISRQVADSIAKHLDALVVEVWTRDGGDLVLMAAIRHEQPAEFPYDLVRRAWEDAAVVERTLGDEEPASRFVALPLTARGEVLGVLAVTLPVVAGDASRALDTVANLLASGISRALAEEERLVLLERERNARGEAQAANRSKDEFLATVSHELRTPLNAITGWTSMLLAGGLDPERTRRAYETINRNARAQAQLIDDLLDIGRITSGRLRLNESLVDVGAVAETALESVRVLVDAKSIQLEARIDPDAGTVFGDSARIQQVVWNLLSNAIKFTPNGGRVMLSVARAADTVAIEVRDTGQGISSEFLPRVFERFKQGGDSSARTRGGLGLGLSIVRHLVELHGGSVRAESEGVGKGALFTVVLPFEAKGRRPSDVVVRSGAPPFECPRDIEGVRVLVVDDEPDALEFLRALLEPCKVEVTTASSVAEGLEQLRASRFDVVLSDLVMPEEDGLSFIRRVRELPREAGGAVPAVALTGYARLEDRSRALQAGFNAHVAKPVDSNELLACLTSLAARR